MSLIPDLGCKLVMVSSFVVQNLCMACSRLHAKGAWLKTESYSREIDRA